MMDEVMSEAVSYRWENKEYLVEVMMKQLGITEEDLENDPSWMYYYFCHGELAEWLKAKLREMNIEKVLEN